MKNRVYWVDVAKLFAIIAVMVDHTNGVLYSDVRVAFLSYYSVSLFIFLMGVTSYWSYLSYNGSMLVKLRTSCLKIYRPYIVASIIYNVISYKKFDFLSIISHIVYFNASGPFYYVLLYLQLIIIMPILYYVIDNHCELQGFAAVLIISEFTNKYSNILDIYGGGGKLFGGTYLFVVYIGMVCGKYLYRNTFNSNMAFAFFAFSFIMTIFWAYLISNSKAFADLIYPPFETGINPPSISLIVYAILIASTLFFLEGALKPDGILMFIFIVLAWLGRHTLYIFLYHRLILDFLIPTLVTAFNIGLLHGCFARIVYFFSMMCGSLLFEYVIEKTHFMLRELYK